MSIKIGIIGAGGMAAYHIKGFRQAGAEVVALADVNKAAADKTAAAQGVGRVYGDVAKMLSDEKGLDAVSVIVPNKFHAPVATQALAVGKHVFCEKPPSLNAAEMTALIREARRQGVGVRLARAASVARPARGRRDTWFSV